MTGCTDTKGDVAPLWSAARVSKRVSKRDIHLNPKIGCDWMPRGVQREVVTPGKNRKAYLAGALNARSGRLHVVEGRRKHAGLFVDLLEELLRRYPAARRIHVVLDVGCLETRSA